MNKKTNKVFGKLSEYLFSFTSQSAQVCYLNLMLETLTTLFLFYALFYANIHVKRWEKRKKIMQTTNNVHLLCTIKV